jgi:hypothetical protein
LDGVVEYPPEPQAPPQIEDIPTWEDKVKQDKQDAEIAADQKALWKDSGNADFFKEQREGENEKSTKDAGYQYISEQDFNIQLADLENKLEWREKWTTDYNEKMSITPFEDPQYDSFQDGYNRNLDESTELGKQIEDLKKRREWSEKTEVSAVPGNNNGFSSSDDAAVAFLNMYQGTSQAENKEYGVVIYENGGKYYLGPTYTGTDGSVTNIFWESTMTPSGLGKVIGTVHTHPTEYVAADTDSDNNSFSGMDMFLPGIRYLGAPNGTVYRNDNAFEKNSIVLQGLSAVGSKDGSKIYSNQPLDTDLDLRFPVLMDVLDIMPFFRPTLDEISNKIP